MNVQTDGRTDRRRATWTDTASYKNARTYLKTRRVGGNEAVRVEQIKLQRTAKTISTVRLKIKEGQQEVKLPFYVRLSNLFKTIEGRKGEIISKSTVRQ